MSEGFVSQGEVSDTCGASSFCQAREIGNTMRNGWRFYFVRTRPLCQQQAAEFVSCWFLLCKCSVLPTTTEISFPVALGKQSYTS